MVVLVSQLFVVKKKDVFDTLRFETLFFPLQKNGFQTDLILVLMLEILEGFSNNGCLDEEKIGDDNFIKN